MTVAEKKTKAYLDSISPDEDRKMMIGYRFLGASSGKGKVFSASKKFVKRMSAKATRPAKSDNLRRRTC